MTSELTALTLGALLQALQIGIAGMVMNKDVGAKWNAGPRDKEPDFSPLTGRLRRAVNNHFEALILFTIAVTVVTLSQSQSALTQACAWVWIIARVFYFPAYGLGLSPWRSMIWALGFVATLIMLIVSLF